MSRLPIIVAVLACTGCCVSNVTKVRNRSGRNILVSTGFPAASIFIPAGAARSIPGVFRGLSDSWVIADSNAEYTFNDVSAIGHLERPCLSRSRFTGDFPCLRFTEHVAIDPQMEVLAVNRAGQKVVQTNGFPIHFTGKSDKQ